MNHYQVSVVNSGGRLVRETVATEYELSEDDGIISVLDGGQCIGQEERLQRILNNSRGWTEDVLILGIKKIVQS